MTAYAVTGTVTPDCTTATTGGSAGTYNGQNYWMWTNDAVTWYLWFVLNKGVPTWNITKTLGSTADPERWFKIGDVSPAGSYVPVSSTGTATVAEVASATYATLTINDGPLAGKYIVLRTG